MTSGSELFMAAASAAKSLLAAELAAVVNNSEPVEVGSRSEDCPLKNTSAPPGDYQSGGSSRTEGAGSGDGAGEKKEAVSDICSISSSLRANERAWNA